MRYQTTIMLNSTMGLPMASNSPNLLSTSALPTLSAFSLPDFSSSDITVYTICCSISSILTFSTLWKVLLLASILLNLKCMPLIYHLRLVNAFRFVMRSQRSGIELTSAHIFQPIITTSRAPLMEIDLNMHKSNSSYFSDNDVARTHLLCTLFSKGVAQMRGSSSALSKPGPMFNMALGAVTCSFRKELKPYEKYEMWSRVLSWDEKWIFIVTHFVKAGKVETKSSLYPEQNKSKRNTRRGSKRDVRKVSGKEESGFDSTRENSPEPQAPKDAKIDSSRVIVASALNKCVFKLGRKTIPPIEMLRISGLLPAEPEVSASTPDFSSSVCSEDSVKTIPFPDFEMEGTEWTWERVEEERVAGLQIAAALSNEAQKKIDESFDVPSDDSEEGTSVLGWHRDGAGVTGVVNTLAQLARMPVKQVL